MLSSFSSPQSSIIQCKDRLGIESPPFDCEYNSIGDRLLVCNENGMITVNSRGDDELMSESLQFVGHENAIFQCKWSFDDSLIVVKTKLV